MKLWPMFIRKIAHPLWMIYDGDGGAIRYLNFFNYLKRFDRGQLLASQKERLISILIHAYENTMYYRNLFDSAGFSPYRMDNCSEIRTIPVLTKKCVKENYEDLVARNIPAGQITRASTGGSTGVPMFFLRDKKCLYLRRGQELFFDEWMGYRIGEKIGYFVAGSHYDGKMSRLKGRLRNATCERMVNFDPHSITNEYMASFADEYMRYRPLMIKCFPNALAPFAQFIIDNGLRMPPVRSISCTGENLYSHQRRMFEQIFGGEVFEKVGTRESGVIACECSIHSGLHVFTEGVYLEIINEKGEYAKPGEMGRLLVTDLFNRAMPLIRYEIGDMAVAGDDRICACGSELPMIEKYLGRDRDIIIDSNGNPKPGYLFVEVIKKLNLDAQIQVIQKTENLLTVRVVKQSGNTLDLNGLKQEYAHILGPGIEIKVEYVDKIERDPSGKFSYVKNEIKQTKRERPVGVP